MATSSATRLDIQLQNYFDQLALEWDNNAHPESLNCLNDIIKELDIKSGDHVLDIASGTGILLPFLIEAVGAEGKITALDFSQNMLLQAKAKEFHSIVDFVQADAAAIPLGEDSVDLAMCNSAFPHFSHKLETLQEIARVLKPNGCLTICHTASRDMINQLHCSIGGVVGSDLLPDELQLRGLLRHAGFTISQLEDTPRRYLVTARKAALANIQSLD